MLLASDVTIAHRPKDADLVKKAAKKAGDRYKEMSGRESKISFEDSLNDDSAGGVTGSTMGGRIRVDNTLQERLKILEEKVSWSFGQYIQGGGEADTRRSSRRARHQEIQPSRNPLACFSGILAVSV